MRWFLAFLKGEQATTAVEYAVMLALILMAVFATISMVGQALGTRYTYINTQIQAHST
jgi:Flp pilus assembly pilin Flp